MANTPVNRWSRIAKRSDEDKQLEDPFEDTVTYTGNYVVDWKGSDNAELLLLCSDKSLNLEKIAAIMQRTKRVIIIQVHQMGTALLKRLGHFDEPTKPIADNLLRYIMETFDIDDTAIAGMRKFAKRHRENKEKFDALMNAELEHLTDPTNKLHLTHDPLVIQKQLVEQTIERITAGTPTNIVGPLLVELLTRTIKIETIESIAEAINRPVIVIRHKLALVATKFASHLSFNKSSKPVLNRVHDPTALANLLIRESVSNIINKHQIIVPDGVIGFLVQMFNKYITQCELAAAVRYTSGKETSSSSSPVDQVTDYPIHEATTSVANEIEATNDIEEDRRICPRYMKSRLNQEPKVDTVAPPVVPKKVKANVAPKLISLKLNRQQREEPVKEQSSIHSQDDMTHFQRFQQKIQEREARDKQRLVDKIVKLTEELNNFY